MRNNGKRYVTQKAFGRESPYAWFKDVLSMDQWTAASVTVVPALVRVTSEWPHASSVTWLQLVWRWYQLLSGLLVNGHMPRVSRQSRLSLMKGVINAWSRGLRTDLLTFTSNRRLSTKTVRPFIAQEGISSLQMRSVGSYSTSGKEEEGKKERTGGENLIVFLYISSDLLSMEPWAAAKKTFS